MLAIYRKYRPKTFGDLLGQETAAKVLKNAAASGRIGHAYLFYGSRGTGKTTTARLIAKAANCETRINDESFKKNGEPCGRCRPCLEIDEGKALDVIEIDAASNRGIDEIRNLKEGIKFSPAFYRYKIFIIDEAHQLTKEAANALLKTLEEPPLHAIFILATTEIEKIPPTIASRTQRFNFKKLPLTLILGKLKEIAKAEKIKISDEALELVAAAGEGSVRDAESLLDQVISFSKNGIEMKDVETIIGRVGFSKIAALAELLIKSDLKDALDYLAKIEEEGYNLVQLAKDLLHYLRKVAALKFNPELEKFFNAELTSNELETAKKQAAIFNEKRGLELIKSLIRAYSEMRYSPFAIVPLEMAIIESLKRESGE